ncbi:hypothetical protein V1523DRAFT_420777 [Lipomyces doorenjongii]
MELSLSLREAETYQWWTGVNPERRAELHIPRRFNFGNSTTSTVEGSHNVHLWEPFAPRGQKMNYRDRQHSGQLGVINFEENLS